MTKTIAKIIALVLFCSIIFLAWFWLVSQAKMEGEIALPGLRKPVQVSFDSFANPSITAESKNDAYLALGYLTARERLFQMDLMRRKMAGRLAEIFGNKALALDIRNRHLGFSQLARKIVKSLPEHQRHVLDDYTRGINYFIETMAVRPLEFLALGYTPERWQPEDSLLVSLSMFQLLNQNSQDETMVSIMNAVLPKDVVTFLTPDTDIYSSEVLLQGQGSVDDLTAIPVQSLAKLVASYQQNSVRGLVEQRQTIAGSNQWATNKTADGRAILANDMHLPLSVPGIWYQAELHYQKVKIKGITLPGLPLIIAGSNASIAWGFTNAQADVLDLVELSINPDNDDQYLTSEGWQDFQQTTETINIKDSPDHKLTIKKTLWGPVLTKLLMGKRVAAQWSIYQPGAVNLDLMAMDKIDNLDDAIELFNQAGLPALNVMLADDKGQIAWTLTGKIPKRVNFNGSVSVPRSQGDFYWDGFIEASDYPRVINPVSGFLMTANNRVLAKGQQIKYGQNFANSYRAYRIKQGIQKQEHLTAQQMYQLQLDTRTQFYDFYRQLALSVLTEQVLNDVPELQDIRQTLENWKGHADSHSVGFGLLVKFRESLADTLFSYYLQAAKAADKSFRYQWYNQDSALRSLLTAKIVETLPGKYQHWDQFILAMLRQVAEQILQSSGAKLSTLTWGEMAVVNIQHPFGGMHSWAAKLLNMPIRPQSGCRFCVRVANSNFSASMRMVVSPGHEEQMILVESTGQSGNPLSAHYADKYDGWVKGLIPEQTPDDKHMAITLIPG